MHRSLSARFIDGISIGVSRSLAAAGGTADRSPRGQKEKRRPDSAQRAHGTAPRSVRRPDAGRGFAGHGGCLPTTVGETLDMMVLHGCAVMRRSSRAMVVGDLTFASYAGSP
jgi:hypothetical protein